LKFLFEVGSEENEYYLDRSQHPEITSANRGCDGSEDKQERV
jgi:hypothetical protein